MVEPSDRVSAEARGTLNRRRANMGQTLQGAGVWDSQPMVSTGQEHGRLYVCPYKTSGLFPQDMVSNKIPYKIPYFSGEKVCAGEVPGSLDITGQNLERSFAVVPRATVGSSAAALDHPFFAKSSPTYVRPGGSAR